MTAVLHDARLHDALDRLGVPWWLQPGIAMKPRERVARFREASAIKAAHLLPHSVAKWAFIRVAVHATVGPWSNQVVPDLTVLDALQRWDEPTTRPSPWADGTWTP